PPDDLPDARITKVVDGDTVDVAPGGRVRLIGIDTPETVDPRRPVECFGKEASAAAATLLQGRAVRLEADATQDDRDQYDRLLRYVWIDDPSTPGLAINGLPPGTPRLANFELVARGYAHEYTFRTPYKYRELFRQAEVYARQYLIGLWGPDTCAGYTSRPAPTARRA
ncbi:MAG TPA: thermonuclease family protein, partial [Solirubrobacteraceae bacterium]